MAARKDWTTHPLPENHAELTVNWSYSAEEVRRLKEGLIPELMEDKWFVFHEEGKLFFHRSWTGFCVYEVEITEIEAGIRIERFKVSRDLEQYRPSSDEFDINLLRYLIDHLLLGKEVPFPQLPALQGSVHQALSRHHNVGHDRTAEEIKAKRQSREKNPKPGAPEDD